MEIFFGGRVTVKTGDITTQKTDAIVNAANSSLMGGGGVDGAIHKAGGPEILEECREIRKRLYPEGLPVGKAVVTTGGKLKAKYVIHTVGPVYVKYEPKEADRLLVECYASSLAVAREKSLDSIAFPAISTGVYGFPKDRSARVTGDFLKNYIREYAFPQKIDLVFFRREEERIFLENCGWK